MAALQGRWQRVGGTAVDDPWQSLAYDLIEIRPDGLVLILLDDRGRIWQVGTGRVQAEGANGLTVTGRCWRGMEGYECRRDYAFSVTGDRLTVHEIDHESQRLEYRRIGGAGLDPPPTLAPPVPTAWPTPGD